MTIKPKATVFPQIICEDLEKSGLTPDDATRMGWHVDPAGNLVIPYNNGSGFARTRLAVPRQFMKGSKLAYQRYSQPPRTKPELFLPRLGGIDWGAVKGDTSIPLVITEGEKKAAAACKVGLACIGLGGVDCWASKGGVPLPHWDQFELVAREVKITFDSDIIHKAPVRNAARRLANMLILRGAKVTMVKLPQEDAEKTGLDDFLVANGLHDGELARAKSAFENLPADPVAPAENGDQIIDELNEKFAVVTIKGQTLILEEVTTDDGGKSTNLLKAADFSLRMRNRFAISREGKEVTASRAWLEHPKRREYAGVVFEPGGAPPNFYNLWHGLSLRPKPGNCEPLLHHIREVICAGDETIFHYVIGWAADMLQNPANRPGVALAIRGAEGVGKGIFGQVLMRLVAPHSVQVTQGNQIVGRFNSIIVSKLLIFMDEAFWAGDRQAEGILKGLITETNLVVEHKGKEPIQVSNYSRLLLASNSDWIVPAGHGARRYLVLDASDKFKGDRAYFKALIKHIYEEGGLEAFAAHLMKFDLETVDLRSPPKTDALLEQKLETMDTVGRFIFDMLCEGDNCSASEWRYTVGVKQIYEQYCASNKRFPASRTKFNKQLVNMIGVKRDRPMVELSRSYVWRFPPLSECRANFAKYVEAENIAWPEFSDEQTETPPPPRPRKF